MIIIPKKSKILGRVPTKEDLEEGEIAINIANGGEKIYVKNAEGEVVLLGGSDLYTIIAETKEILEKHLVDSEAHQDIRESIKLDYTFSDSSVSVSPGTINGTDIILNELPMPSTYVEPQANDTISTAIGKIVKKLWNK